MPIAGRSFPRRPRLIGRRQALAGACLAAVLAVSGAVTGTAAQAGQVKQTAAPSAKTVVDCLTAAPAWCYGVRQFLAAYGVEPLLRHGIDGRGQTVVLPELAYPAPNAVTSNLRQDLALFDGLSGLPAARVQVITRFAGASEPNLAGPEEMGDTEMVHAVAPAAAIRIVLLPQPGAGGVSAAVTDFVTALRLAPSLGGVAAITAGLGESCFTAAETAELASVLQVDAQQHLTVVAASGDNGAAIIPCPGALAPVKGVNLPQSDPFVLAAGGTSLTANPQTGAYLGETAWNTPPPPGVTPPPGEYPVASNGGFSSLFPRPAYQAGIPGIGPMRGVPDVAADAGPTSGMAVVAALTAGNIISSADGTSAAAPFWAGIVALADQCAGRHLGFINPVIYRIARSPAYHRAFHDITSGNNTVTYSNVTVAGYQAAPGWDPVTGWGSPNAQVLVPLLAAGR
jgi:subtilase family serine protease